MTFVNDNVGRPRRVYVDDYDHDHVHVDVRVDVRVDVNVDVNVSEGRVLPRLSREAS